MSKLNVRLRYALSFFKITNFLEVFNQEGVFDFGHEPIQMVQFNDINISNQINYLLSYITLLLSVEQLKSYDQSNGLLWKVNFSQHFLTLRYHITPLTMWVSFKMWLKFQSDSFSHTSDYYGFVIIRNRTDFWIDGISNAWN